MKLIDINSVRGKRNLSMTMNGETWDVGIREGTFTNVSGTMRSSANGEVIEWKNFWDGSLEIAHNDVVVRNCFFRNLNYHTLYPSMVGPTIKWSTLAMPISFSRTTGP